MRIIMIILEHYSHSIKYIVYNIFNTKNVKLAKKNLIFPFTYSHLWICKIRYFAELNSECTKHVIHTCLLQIYSSCGGVLGGDLNVTFLPFFGGKSGPTRGVGCCLVCLGVAPESL